MLWRKWILNKPKELGAASTIDNMRAHPWLYIMILPAIAYFDGIPLRTMYGVIIAFQDYKLKGIMGSKCGLDLQTSDVY